MREILLKMYISLHVTKRYSNHMLIKIKLSGQVFEKYSNIKCH